jgi:hypothetical protein
MIVPASLIISCVFFTILVKFLTKHQKKTTVWQWVLFLASPILMLAVACTSQTVKPGDSALPETTTTSTTVPSEVPPAGPLPGAAYSGPLLELDKASGGMLSLTVSQDGTKVETVSLMLMSVQCDTFSSGLMMHTVKGEYPIQDGKLSAEISGIGQIQVQFDTQNSASAQVHLLLDPGTGAVCDIGSTAWLGVLVEETPEPPQAPGLPSEPTSVPELTSAPPEPPSGVLVDTAVPAPEVLRTVPPPESQVLIVNDRVVDLGDKILVTGEVENRTQDTLQTMQVSVKLIDSNGGVLYEQDTYVNSNYCSPDERVPFLVLLDRPTGFAGYRLDVTYGTTPAMPEERIEITEEYLLAHPLPHVIGWAQVGGDESVEFGSVIGIFYDAEGKVVDIGQSFPPAAGGILNPGESRPFSLMPLYGSGFDHYRLIIDRGLLGLQPYPELEILDVQEQESSLTGVVHNSTSKAAIYVFVWATFYDAQGKLLDVQNMPLEPFDLQPNESGTFNFILAPPGYDHYQLFVGYDPEF